MGQVRTTRALMQNRVMNAWTCSLRCEIRNTFFYTRFFYESNFYKSSKILLRSLLLFLVVLSEMKMYCFDKTSSHRCITLSYSEIYWCAALLYKSNFSPDFPTGMQRWNNCFITTPSLLLLLCRSFIFVWNVLGPSNTLITCCRAHFAVEVNFLNHEIIEILGYLVEPPLFFSGPSWAPSSSQGRPLKGCLHIETVYIVFGASLFKGFFLPACTGVWPARAGRYAYEQWPVCFPLKSRLHSAEPQGGWHRDGVGSGMLSSSFNS